MERQIFISHTKKDEDTCNAFERVIPRVGIKAFRSEFEDIHSPAWETIKKEINNSRALFFLVGKELVNSQYTKQNGWEYTQNWIAYEIGVACQQGIDVWAICDDVEINFPMPYVNNYMPNIKLKENYIFNYLREILENYKKGFVYPATKQLRIQKKGRILIQQEVNATLIQCPICKIEFNLRVELQPGQKIKCPQCLGDIVFEGGFFVK